MTSEQPEHTYPRNVVEFMEAINRGDALINDWPMPGIIDNAGEWIADGWNLKGTPTPAMIAAALINEAHAQLTYEVPAGISTKEYPEILRLLANQIIERWLQDAEKEEK